MPKETATAKILPPGWRIRVWSSLRSRRGHGSLTIRRRMLCKSLRMTTLWGTRLHPRGKNGSLFAEAGLHRHPLATFGAPARQYRGSALGLHARTESVLLRALTPVRLESALGHEKWLLLIRSMAFRQTMSINDAGQTRQTRTTGNSPGAESRFAAERWSSLWDESRLEEMLLRISRAPAKKFPCFQAQLVVHFGAPNLTPEPDLTCCAASLRTGAARDTIVKHFSSRQIPRRTGDFRYSRSNTLSAPLALQL
jgi:hypothetical protein